MTLWFAGSICSLLAHCIGTGSILVLPLGYGFLSLMGGEEWDKGEEEGKSKEGMVRSKEVMGERDRMGEKGTKRKGEIIQRESAWGRSKETVGGKKAERGKQWEMLLFATIPIPLLLAVLGHWWAGGEGWCSLSWMPVTALPCCCSSCCKQAQSLPELHN